MTRSIARKFLRAATQRLTTAEFLLKNDYNLDAMYLAGYAMECALKALILENTPKSHEIETLKKITHGAAMHLPEELARLLRDLRIELPRDFKRQCRKSGWSTSLRYDPGRKATKEAKAFIEWARDVLRWVKERCLQ